MRSFFKFLLVTIIIAAALYYGYSYLTHSIERQINKSFPPLSVADGRNNSLLTNASALNAIHTPDVAVNIGDNEFMALLDSAARHELTDTQLHMQHVAHYSFENIKTGLDEQVLDLSTDFSFELDTLQAKVAGSLQGMISFGFRHDSLVFFPALQTLHVSNISLEGHSGTDKDLIVEFLNKVLHAGIDNINSAISSATHGIDLNLIHKKIDSTVLPQNDSISISLSKPLDISMPELTGAVLIDKAGLHILAAFGHQVAAGDVAGSSSFDNYSEAYYSTMANGFPDAPGKEQTFVIMTKKFIAGLINSNLSEEVINGIYNKDIIPKPIEKEIMIKASDIDCSKLNYNCPSLPMPPLPSPPPLPDCNRHCKWWQQPACGGLEAGCRLGEAGLIASWNAACEGILAPWRAKNLEIQATCKSLTIPAAAACQTLKTTIDAAGGQVDLGTVTLDGKAHIKAYAELKSLQLAPDLSSVAFSLSSSAVVPVHIDFRLHSKTAGRLVCPFDITYPVDCIGSGQMVNNVTSKLAFKEGNKDTIILSFEVSPLNAQTTLSPAPLEIINGTFSSSFLSCPILSQTVGGVGVTLNIVKQFHDIFDGTDKGDLLSLIFDGKYNVATGNYPIDLPIACKPVKLLNDSLNLQSVVRTNYLGFQLRQ